MVSETRKCHCTFALIAPNSFYKPVSYALTQAMFAYVAPQTIPCFKIVSARRPSFRFRGYVVRTTKPKYLVVFPQSPTTTSHLQTPDFVSHFLVVVLHKPLLVLRYERKLCDFVISVRSAISNRNST